MQLLTGALLLAQTSHLLLEPGILPAHLLQVSLGLRSPLIGLRPQLALALKLLR